MLVYIQYSIIILGILDLKFPYPRKTNPQNVLKYLIYKTQVIL